jgi:hypothetical protein
LLGFDFQGDELVYVDHLTTPAPAASRGCTATITPRSTTAPGEAAGDFAAWSSCRGTPIRCTRNFLRVGGHALEAKTHGCQG